MQEKLSPTSDSREKIAVSCKDPYYTWHHLDSAKHELQIDFLCLILKTHWPVSPIAAKQSWNISQMDISAALWQARGFKRNLFVKPIPIVVWSYCSPSSSSHCQRHCQFGTTLVSDLRYCSASHISTNVIINWMDSLLHISCYITTIKIYLDDRIWWLFILQLIQDDDAVRIVFGKKSGARRLDWPLFVALCCNIDQVPDWSTIGTQSTKLRTKTQHACKPVSVTRQWCWLPPSTDKSFDASFHKCFTPTEHLNLLFPISDLRLQSKTQIPAWSYAQYFLTPRLGWPILSCKSIGKKSKVMLGEYCYGS